MQDPLLAMTIECCFLLQDPTPALLAALQAGYSAADLHALVDKAVARAAQLGSSPTPALSDALPPKPAKHKPRATAMARHLPLAAQPDLQHSSAPEDGLSGRESFRALLMDGDIGNCGRGSDLEGQQRRTSPLPLAGSTTLPAVHRGADTSLRPSGALGTEAGLSATSLPADHAPMQTAIAAHSDPVISSTERHVADSGTFRSADANGQRSGARQENGGGMARNAVATSQEDPGSFAVHGDNLGFPNVQGQGNYLAGQHMNSEAGGDIANGLGDQAQSHGKRL